MKQSMENLVPKILMKWHEKFKRKKKVSKLFINFIMKILIFL